MGIELQESHNLCPWAKTQPSIQKKILFSFEDLTSQRKLGGVVIDGADIEFVLEPFSHNEEHLLNKATKSVLTACKFLMPRDPDQTDLQNALNHSKVTNLIGKNNFERKVAAALRVSENQDFSKAFGIWKAWLLSHEKYKDSSHEELEQIWNVQLQEPVLDLNRIFALAGLANSSEITFDEWLSKMKNPFSAEGINISTTSEYEEVKRKTIRKTPQVSFEPQVTLQYPIEYSIPLFFSLFGMDKNSPTIKQLVFALPLLNNIEDIKSGNTREYFTKEKGLSFLHALTLLGITSTDKDDLTLLHKLEERHLRGQVDAKGALILMSRRPFSDMWKDIIAASGQEITLASFLNLYLENMTHNNLFFDRFAYSLGKSGTSEGAPHIIPNYGEEYVTLNGTPRDLTFLADFFTPEFKEKCGDVSYSFLKKGILSTVMIRNFDPKRVKIIKEDRVITPQTVFENYVMQAIETIPQPNIRYEFDLVNKELKEKSSAFDILSPPLFLDDEDSMGAYKGYDPAKILEFGEAIIEIRLAKNIPVSYLRSKLALEATTSSQGAIPNKFFLTNVNSSLEEHANLLFKFLKELNAESFFSNEYINDIYNCVSK